MSASKDSMNIDASTVQEHIRKHPEDYAEFRKHIIRLLSILGIESHIWASDITLEIMSSRSDILDAMIKQASGGIIAGIEALNPTVMKKLQDSYSVSNS